MQSRFCGEGEGPAFICWHRLNHRENRFEHETEEDSLVQVCYIVCLSDNVDVKTEANKDRVKWASRSNGVSNEVHQGSSGRRVDRWNFRAFVCNSFPSIKI